MNNITDEVVCTLPNFIKIVKTNDYGYTLESTKFIKNGCIVYTGNFYNIPNNNKLYKLIIKSSDDKEPLIFENIGNKNTVKENETTRNLYTFDGFMNHSCNYNTISSETRTTSIPNRFEYDQIAVKDIHVGDQITCNYLHFDYNCDGHIFDCLCGSSNCYGEISGFKNCSLKQQLELLPHIDKIMLEQFKRENDDILFKNISFENKNIDIFVNNNNSFFGIKSKKTFKKDEIVLENNIEQIPLDKKVIVNISNKYILLDNDIHFTRQESSYEYYGIETFTNHSCNPNCSHILISDSTYQMKALREIKEGEEITCDYNNFQTKYDVKPFECLCGYEYCRGIIY